MTVHMANGALVIGNNLSRHVYLAQLRYSDV